MMTWRDRHGAIPMHSAADEGLEDIVRLLYNAGCPIDIKGPVSCDQNVFVVFVQFSFLYTFRIIKSLTIIKMKPIPRF